LPPGRASGAIAVEAIAELDDPPLAVGEVLERSWSAVLGPLSMAASNGGSPVVGGSGREPSSGGVAVAPTGFSSDTGTWPARMITSASSVDAAKAAISSMVGHGRRQPRAALGAVELWSTALMWMGCGSCATCRDRPRDGLADPPGCVGGELEALAVVELLHGSDQSDEPSWIRSRTAGPGCG